MKTQMHDPQLSEGIMRRGFPRPLFDTKPMRSSSVYNTYEYPRFLPTPYTAQTEAIAMLSSERARECLVDSVCSVCGESVEFNEQGWMTVLFKNGKLTYESGPFHEKCAKLTMTMCPHIAHSGEWSIGMVNRDTWARNIEFQFTHGTYDANGYDCRPVTSLGYHV